MRNEIYVLCGCFNGNINDFIYKVRQTHGNNYHAVVYNVAAELRDRRTL